MWSLPPLFKVPSTPGSSFIWLDVSPMKQAEAIITILQMSKLRHRYKAKVVEFMFFKTRYSNTERILHKIWRKHRSQVTAGQGKKEKGGPCLTEARAFSHRTPRRPWPLSDHSPQAGLLSHTLTEGRGQLFETPWTVACQAPPSMGFSRQESWSGLTFPSPQC